MKKRSYHLYIIGIIFICLTSFTCEREIIDNNPIQGSLQPVSEGEIIEHTYFSLAYSEANEGAIWVYYHLTPDHINGDAERKDNFKEDPLVSTGSATLDDYKGSGYDRGHLAPAAAMKINQLAMDESFMMSNVSPQVPSLNRGRLKSLETQVREWVLSMGELYVVSGAIYSDPITSIGENEVTVPSRYYKVVYDGQKMIGFIMPNEKCDQDIAYYAVSVDSVEMEMEAKVELNWLLREEAVIAPSFINN